MYFYSNMKDGPDKDHFELAAVIDLTKAGQQRIEVEHPSTQPAPKPQ